MENANTACSRISLCSATIGALLGLPRRTKRLIMLGADTAALPMALWAALVLKFDRLMPGVGQNLGPLFIAVAPALLVFYSLGVYRTVIRFMGPKVTVGIIAGVSVSVLAAAFFGAAMGGAQVPLSAFAIYWLLAVVYIVGSRLLARFVLTGRVRNKKAARVLIYGAGNAGARLSAALRGASHYKPVAFVDDDETLQGSQVNGIRVYRREALPELVSEWEVEHILLAMPAISRRRRCEILATLEPLGVRVQSIPDQSDIISGKAHIDDLRAVEVDDLLGRDPVPPNPWLLEKGVRGKCVLVTGAGGSIGGELCRQILKVAPRRLVLLEISELALYTIERELREVVEREDLAVEIVPLLGSVHHRQRIREVLATCSVQTLYHAAAYKHVPIVEHNILEGIHNNVIGTWYTAEAALEAGIETFVLISTDKAVNPSNVMGATKRLAELVLQALQRRTARTRFCMVRFGNVLASSGSVVPLFQEQIRRGGPVTVTDPDVIRYFMTIREAAQLVIQASSMATGGDVFVLDMGRPVRIDDLARRLINLTGLTVREPGNPDGDIEIKYTGLRASEKLFEELLIGTNVTRTEHAMIWRAIEHSLTWERTQQILNDLLSALASSDCHRAVALLSDAVIEYRRTQIIRDHVWNRRAALPAPDDGKIADLGAKRRHAEVTVKPLLERVNRVVPEARSEFDRGLTQH